MTKRNDGAESLLFKRQLEHIQAEVESQPIVDYRYAEFVPTGPFGMPAVKNVYTYRQYDKYGLVKWIQAYSDDLPKVNIKGTEVSVVAKQFGNAWGFSDDEIAAVASEGGNLQADGADAARTAHEAFFDTLAAVGDSTVGLTGLLNLSNTTSFTPSTKAATGTSWGTLTAPNATVLEILGDLNGIAAAIIAATKAMGMLAPNAIILPLDRYVHIASRPMSTDSSHTVLKHFLATNPWIKSVDHWWRCDTAGSGSGTRMVCYRRDPKVVKFIVPRNFEQSQPERKGDGVEVRCKSKTAGVISVYPLAVAYGDGI